ncbi:spore germination protein [Paenibacillus taihuensis]|uniref:Spore germination protein n=1 Tax=Paenibacillus taihuensis TaxID=1156355 RepID=A0A3D9S096_9BACL|nr:spore germination protein [Paenibacillus taihuensis]REE85148.1 spore germination protein [Paenibacillus taihuensis]
MGFFRSILRGKPRRHKPSSSPPPVLSPASGQGPISKDLESNIQQLQARLSQSPDLVTRRFPIKSTGERAALIYLDSLSDKVAVNHDVLRPLMHETSADPQIENLVTVGRIKSETGLGQIVKDILQGASALFIANKGAAYIIDTHGWPQRAIEDPQLEASLKGAHQGFVETSSQNIALIRRYIPDRELKMIELEVGARGLTTVSILYLADVAKPEVLQELVDRIKQIDIDALLSSGELEEYIEDNPYSPFPQFSTTERPDSVASQILQGRLAIVVDKSPGVLIGPANFAMFFQSIDDYSIRWQVSSFIRLLRFGAFFLTIFLPSFYIAVISYNFEVIPLKLLLSVGESRQGVPFPPIVEALIMELTLEMLKEAGIRLPAPIGQTVGIVGAIVIGQATVQAGVVSNIMVIVVSLTALSSFIIPNNDMSAAIRLIRFPMMLAAFVYGLLGVGIGMLIVLGHLISLESLGTPYFSPFGPLRFADLKDSIIRLPMWKMVKRPLSSGAVQQRKHGSNRGGNR